MTPGEHRLLEFVAVRLESMLRRPAVWGSLPSVEDQILQLLEFRRMLLDASAVASDTQRLTRAYTRFIARVIKDATPQSLAVQLEAGGRGAEFSKHMKSFVDEELAVFVAEQAVASDNGGAEASPEEIERTKRVLESLRMDAEVHARRAPAPLTQAIRFPEGPN